MMKSLFEQNDGTYRQENGYKIPNLILPEKPEYLIGIWGLRRLTFLKKHKRTLYINLMTSGKLAEHLREINITAMELRETITRQMAQEQGITENFKAKNQMLWVSKMNNIHACADEIIQNELIYD